MKYDLASNITDLEDIFDYFISRSDYVRAKSIAEAIKGLMGEPQKASKGLLQHANEVLEANKKLGDMLDNRHLIHIGEPRSLYERWKLKNPQRLDGITKDRDYM